jgi:hypothetical protein
LEGGHVAARAERRGLRVREARGGRTLDDGSCTSDLASGTSGSLTGETIETARLLAGSTYRIEAHLWAGTPGTQVAIQATFYDSAGVAGT